MKAIVISLSFAAVLASAAICEEAAKSPSEMTPEMAVVLANDRAYEAAYAKGDVAALGPPPKAPELKREVPPVTPIPVKTAR